MKRLVIILILFSSNAKCQDYDLANILVGIADSVKQLTLSPLEKYNKHKPFERSYISYSQPINTEFSKNNIGGRIELFHTIGFYVGIPTSTNSDVEPNTTLEQIVFGEYTAQLQGLNYQKSELLNTITKSTTFDLGLIFAPIPSSPLAKNIFVSIGLTSSRITDLHRYTNNSLLGINNDFIVYDNTQVYVGADFGLKYVLPYIQVGLGYKVSNVSDGLHLSAGLNIPIRVFLYTKKIAGERNEFHWYKWQQPNMDKGFDKSDKWKKLDKDANEYKNTRL
jgi:hypothetical protein